MVRKRGTGAGCGAYIGIGARMTYDKLGSFPSFPRVNLGYN